MKASPIPSSELRLFSDPVEGRFANARELEAFLLPEERLVPLLLVAFFAISKNLLSLALGTLNSRQPHGIHRSSNVLVY